MYMQNKDFEEIYDIYAVRIILDNVPECYTALGLIHDMYINDPNEIRTRVTAVKGRCLNRLTMGPDIKLKLPE